MKTRKHALPYREPGLLDNPSHAAVVEAGMGGGAFLSWSGGKERVTFMKLWSELAVWSMSWESRFGKQMIDSAW
ncbi:MAG: hypothetical protein LKE96_05810 [Acetobacter peroxydans]|nr:hypothetical protein [Acetobacter peroxydans]MCI2008576.1 hypothetical protein [Acetobacter peroxydans]MCI2078108.1 hypothetical protein [Acetobacter peroxydans]